MAFFGDEPGADIVRDLILKAEENKVSLLMCVVNLGEVWYSIARTNSPEVADEYIGEINGMAIEIVDADWDINFTKPLHSRQGGIFHMPTLFCGGIGERLKKAELITWR